MTHGPQVTVECEANAINAIQGPVQVPASLRVVYPYGRGDLALDAVRRVYDDVVAQIRSTMPNREDTRP